MKHKLINEFLLILLAVGTFNMTACSNKVHLTFIQHSYIGHAMDENRQTYGYYFKNDEIARTEFEYKYGYYLSKEDIDSFNSKTLNYDVPTLNGDGYFGFTAFTIDFNEETGLSTQFLEPCKLTKDLTIHFGIYG